LKEVSKEDYEKFKTVLVGKVKEEVDYLAKSWESITVKTFKNFNEQLRSLYELMRFKDEDVASEVNPYIIDSIHAVELELDDFMRKNPSQFTRYVNGIVSGLINPEVSEEDSSPDVFEQKEREVLQSFAELDPIVRMEGDKCVVDNNGQKWTISIYYMRNEKCFLTVSSLDNPDILIVLNKEELTDKISRGKFQEVADEATFNYENEKGKRDIVEKFDLPKDQPISYFSVLPATYDPIVASTMQGSRVFAHSLERKYSNLKTYPTIFSDDPKKDLAERIQDSYAQGCRYFYLDFYQHGSESEIKYKTGLKASDVTEIVQKFPDAKFVINTVACYGGGFRDGFSEQFAKDPDLKDRVTLFLQTKPDVPNPVGTTMVSVEGDSGNEEMQVRGSYYHAFLTLALLSGKTYGQAVAIVDRMAKKYTEVDAEEIINGELISKVDQSPSDEAKV